MDRNIFQNLSIYCLYFSDSSERAYNKGRINTIYGYLIFNYP